MGRGVYTKIITLLRGGASEPALKRMRNKLLVVNLVSLTLVVTVAFSIIYVNFYNRIQNEIEETLSAIPRGVIENLVHSQQRLDSTSSIVTTPGAGGWYGSAITISGEPYIPVDYSKSFVVNIVSDESVTVFSMLDLDNEDYTSAIESALGATSPDGTISIAGRAWRFSVDTNEAAFRPAGFPPYRQSIVFLDVEDTNRRLGELAASLFGIGIVAIIAILLISLLVANRAIRPVEESMARQRRFVADASHELKTPIAIIAANAEAAGGAALMEGGGALEDVAMGDGLRDDGGLGDGSRDDGILGDGSRDDGVLGDGLWDDGGLGDGSRADGGLGDGVRDDDSLPEKRDSVMRWIRNIQDEASRMNELVDNLLSLAKAEEKQAARISFDLITAVCEEADRVEASLFEKNIVFDFGLRAGHKGPLPVFSDRTKVQAILSVLFENAVKYTPDGGRVTLSVGKGGVDSEKVSRGGGVTPFGEEGFSPLDGKAKSGVWVSVSNTGEFIPPESLDHIFDRFFRTDRSRSSETGGHGIGLSIAKEIAHAIGGELTAMSIPRSDGVAVNTFTLFL